MKRAVVIIFVLMLLFTAAALCFMPERIPMHYNASGNIDRWGSRYELFITPLIGAAVSALMLYFARPDKAAENEKEQAAQNANSKVLGAAALCISLLFAGIQLFMIYKAWTESKSGVVNLKLDSLSFTSQLMGLLMLILGNLMPKTRMNGTIGLRVSWSMYNDVTWQRSNRFGGFALSAAGLLVLLVAGFLPGAGAVALLLISLFAALAVSLIYARKVWLEEKSRARSEDNKKHTI